MQREAHASVPKPGQDPLNPHTFSALVIPKPITTPACRPPTAADSIEPLPHIAVSQSSFTIAHHGGSAASTLNTVDPAFQLPSHPSVPPAPDTQSQTSGHSHATDSVLNTIPQTTWTSPPTVSNSFTQQPQQEPLNRDLDSSPALSDSSGCSPFAQVQSSSVTPTVPQHEFQFQSHTNLLGMCPPFNTSSSPGTFELGITLDATLSPDTACAEVSTFGQFQNSHQPIPHRSHDFNHQIPLYFDFSRNAAPYYPSNYPNSSAFRVPYMNGPDPPPETQISDTFNSAIHPTSSIAQSDPSAFNSMHIMAPMVNWSTSSSVNLACGVNTSNSDQAQNTF